MANQPEPIWSDRQLDDPHAVADKSRRVREMFAAIAPSYDLNNRLHSLWRDQAWRRWAVRLSQLQPTDHVLDVACGTGDLSMAFENAGASRVIGVDFTPGMLTIAHDKAVAHRGATRRSVTYHAGDGTRLPIADRSVDVVSIAFGIRNIATPAAAIQEFARVLRPGGRLVILEFSLPRNTILRAMYNFYFKRIMPVTASLVARDRSGAYRYLPQSVNTFLDRDALMALCRERLLDKPHGDLPRWLAALSALPEGPAECDLSADTLR
ncbi:MAG: ubiquinone/menaquinone biosynthesis methyltransferase, partial [Phycisphaeraceae bacterium]|nr:ubiquinone/menaquinone biosynthesis methyltransferase [Phycisphaeraceae bacterium]